MSALTNKFRRWYKGSGRIIRIQQGDDNLIAVIFKTLNTNDYSVGGYRYGENVDGKITFNLVELEEKMSKQEALNKFRKIVREF